MRFIFLILLLTSSLLFSNEKSRIETVYLTSNQTFKEYLERQIAIIKINMGCMLTEGDEDIQVFWHLHGELEAYEDVLNHWIELRLDRSR